MNTKEVTQPLTFKKSVQFWTVHGVICAAPSFAWGIATLNVRVATISAMLTGTAILILIYTWLSLRTRISIDKRYGSLASSIRWAAHLRAFITLLSALTLLPRGLGSSFFIPFAALDFIPGKVVLFWIYNPDTLNLITGELNKFAAEFLMILEVTLLIGIVFSIIFFFLIAFVRLFIWIAT